MQADIFPERLQAHALLDMLPDEKFNVVRNLLEVLLEPVQTGARSRMPVDDEQLTPESAAALDRARVSLARGGGIPHDEILREFGLN